jgi:hypothetical protein
MARVTSPNIRFRQSPAPDVVSNRVRVRPANTVAAYDTPFQDVPKPVPGADGYTLIPVASITALTGVEGRRDVHVTAVDANGNESDFLEIDNVLFDLSPPAAPTDGSIV